jgi:uridine kinase
MNMLLAFCFVIQEHVIPTSGPGSPANSLSLMPGFCDKIRATITEVEYFIAMKSDQKLLTLDQAPPGSFQISSPRPTVEIHLPDGRVISGPRYASVGQFLRCVEDTQSPIIGAVVNNNLRELTFPIDMDCRVRPVTMSDEDGMLIYRRSLTFLMDATFETLFPDSTLTVDHSVSAGGFYCQTEDHRPISEADLDLLKEHMRSLVEQDLPFIRREAPLNEAIAYFEAKGYHDKVRLLKHRKKDHLVLYRLGDHQDYHHGYMVPSTGYLRWFDIIATNGGFTLQFPRRHAPTQLSPMPNYPKLLAAFRRYAEWLGRLGIAYVGALNDAIEAGRIREIILTSEALHEQFVAQIASQIAEQKERVQVVLISGPSSSGKTTFSKRLAVQLLSQGISPFPLEMDNYFVDRDMTPRDEQGQLDFESVRALDTNHLGEDIRRLIQGETVHLPHFNFITGVQEKGDWARLSPGQMIILEGIHGLNPQLLPGFSAEQTFRIYVSALTQLNLDNHNRISTTDTRLLRRLVRDARERGYAARDTIHRWDSVRRGEKRNIFPYQENADVMFNSALVYELSVLKPFVEPLLRQVPHTSPEFIEAKRLLVLLEWIMPVEDHLVPDNSILREFIGNSSLRDFKLWD